MGRSVFEVGKNDSPCVISNFAIFSRYNLPYHPLRLLDPIYGGAVYHDFHHMVRGRASNYGGYKVFE